MFHLLFLAIKWVFRNAFNFALILAVLIACSWIMGAWKTASNALAPEIKEWQKAAQHAEEKLADLEQQKTQAEANAKSIFEGQMHSLNTQKNTIQKQLDDAKSNVKQAIAALDDKEKTLEKLEIQTDWKAEELRRAIDDDWFVWSVSWVSDTAVEFFVAKKTAELEAAKFEERAEKIAYGTAESAKDAAERASNSIRLQMEDLDRAIKKTEKWTSDSNGTIAADFADRKAKLDAELARIHAEIQRLTDLPNPEHPLWIAAKEHFVSAFLILIGILISPLLVRAICYYTLAPLASKLPPVCVLPNPSAPAIPPASPSSVSLSIDLTPDKELLIHQGFLQTCDTKIEKHTKWVLNPRIPFTSISSGMWMLTQLRCSGNRPTRIAVAAQNDVFGELATIELPRGAAMVVHPRSLAGVVQSLARPVQITRHWRLFSLHAWLTLQLRYIVLHGPCTLILKGCRGVKAEAPQAQEPRMLNQAATIGFSANLEYKNIRCETFMAYNDGKENLFNDQFSGGRGVYLYEELPDHRRTSGGPVRILQSTVEVALRALGI